MINQHDLIVLARWVLPLLPFPYPGDEALAEWIASDYDPGDVNYVIPHRFVEHTMCWRDGYRWMQAMGLI